MHNPQLNAFLLGCFDHCTCYSSNSRLSSKSKSPPADGIKIRPCLFSLLVLLTVSVLLVLLVLLDLRALVVAAAIISSGDGMAI